MNASALKCRASIDFTKRVRSQSQARYIFTGQKKKHYFKVIINAEDVILLLK